MFNPTDCMKVAITGLFSFLILFVNCQVIPRTDLNVYVSDCRMQEHILISADTLWLYKQDTLVQRTILSIGQGMRDPIIIHNLLPGKYQLSFVNIYGQQISKILNVPGSGVFTCRICPDQTNDLAVNTLSKLNIGESVCLRFKETGCFADGSALLRITRKKGCFVASLDDRENGSHKVYTQKLTPKMEADFTDFENQLRLIKDGGLCTTQDCYTVESKYGTFSKRDGFCYWEGFYLLKRSLFGQPN